jgi:hypothetical protein
MTTPRKRRSKSSPPMESDSSAVRPEETVSNGDIILEMLGNETGRVAYVAGTGAETGTAGECHFPPA